MYKVFCEKKMIKNVLYLEVVLNLKYIGVRVVVVWILLNRIDRKFIYVFVKDENDVFWGLDINKYIFFFC